MENNSKPFKVGDKVRRLKPWCDERYFKENEIYTVSSVKNEETSGYMDIEIKETINSRYKGPWDSNKFELVESKVQYQIGKFYKNKVGGAVHECVDLTLGGLPVMKNANSTKAPVFIYQGNNLEEYTPPRTGKVWLNIYEDGRILSWDCKIEADRWQSKISPRIACVEVSWTEGQGL